MILIASFTNLGKPALGLSPTINIWRISNNAQVVTNAPMVEVGDGIYKYSFLSASAGQTYGFRADSGQMMEGDSDRYAYGEAQAAGGGGGGGAGDYVILNRRRYRR